MRLNITAPAVILTLWLSVVLTAPMLDDFAENFAAQHRSSLFRGDMEADMPADSFNADSPVIEDDANASYVTRGEEVITLRRSETIGSMLKRVGVPASQVTAILKALRDKTNMRKLRAGQEFLLRFDSTQRDPVLLTLNYSESIEKRFEINRQPDSSYLATVILTPLKNDYVAITGSVNGSFAESASKAGMSARMIRAFIQIMSSQVNVNRLRTGDSFTVLQEGQFDDSGELIRSGNILYASATRAGTLYEIYRFENNGRTSFFRADGTTQANDQLLSSPIPGARITSGFGMRRHPILGYRIAHKGIDYGAKTGTPIYAAGDGVIAEIGRKGAFGNYIRITHNRTYDTAYAHLSRFGAGMRRGTRVSQGQLIGYVGTTGRSTGPHLHYEIHQNGVPINPLTAKIMQDNRLKGSDLTKFRALVRARQALLANRLKTRITPKDKN